MQTKVLIIYPNVAQTATMQMGIASLSAVLKEHDFSVELFDFTFLPMSDMTELLKEKIDSYAPDIIGVSCRSLEWPTISSTLEAISPKAVVVFGGSHATVASEEVIAHPIVDFLILGEGEDALLELVQHLRDGKDNTHIENLWLKHKKSGKIIRNPVRPFIHDLDRLPFPDYKLFDTRHFKNLVYHEGKLQSRIVVPVETSRGCPYSCSYCINDYVQNLYRQKGKYHRDKSVEKSIATILHAKREIGVNYVYFIDETFLLSPVRLKSLLKEYKERVGLPFSFQTHPKTLTLEKAEIVAEAGASIALVGIESGSESYRRNYLKRQTTNEDIIRAFTILKSVKIPTFSFNMVGMPDETREMIEATIELNREIQPDAFQATLFYPFKGTKLREHCKDSIDTIKSNRVKSFHTASTIKHKYLKQGQPDRISKLFFAYIRWPKWTFPLLRFAEHSDFLCNIFLLINRFDYLKNINLYVAKYGFVGLVKRFYFKYRM